MGKATKFRSPRSGYWMPSALRSEAQLNLYIWCSALGAE